MAQLTQVNMEVLVKQINEAYKNSSQEKMMELQNTMKNLIAQRAVEDSGKNLNALDGADNEEGAPVLSTAMNTVMGEISGKIKEDIPDLDTQNGKKEFDDKMSLAQDTASNAKDDLNNDIIMAKTPTPKPEPKPQQEEYKDLDQTPGTGR